MTSPLPLQRRAVTWPRFLGPEVLALPPQTTQLTNGRYHVSLTSTGSGRSSCGDVAVSRWAGDPTCDVDGVHVYFRDLEDGFLWSAGYQPTRVEPDSYEFRFAAGLAEIVRTDRELASCLSVCVSPRHDFELRRVRLTNHSRRPRRIELTSYVELVLHRHEADAHHPAFSKLFVETQFLPEHRAIVARRRPRSPEEPEHWALHRVLPSGVDACPSELEFETNRTRFIGRGRTLRQPWALQSVERLGGETGPVLDPIASLRVVVPLAPAESREVVYVLGAAQSCQEIEALAEASADWASLLATFEEACTSDYPGDGEASVQSARQAGGTPGRRVVPHLPHRFIAPSLTNGSGARDTAQPVYQPAAGSDVSPRPSSPRPTEALLFDNGLGGFTADGREYVIRLRADARGDHIRPPQPWCNVVANERGGFIVSESGAGYTWAGNSRLNRLTAWHNDPVCDPHAEALWIRDEEAGVFWSPTPGPTPAGADYEVRHGFGYTTFRHESHGLAQNLMLFMAPEEPVKLARLLLTNTSGRTRRLTVYSYAHWALGDLAAETVDSITTTYDDALQAILAINPQREIYGGHVAFSSIACDGAGEAVQISGTGDRGEFIGRGGDLQCPRALAAGERWGERFGTGTDPCAAWQVSFELPPGGTFECTLLLGEAADRDAAAALITEYRASHAVQDALAVVTQRWRDTLSAVEVETPDREIDLMVNGWLAYQNLSCRMWARSAYYQPGGAFGFRDQLQDAAALVYHQPELTRQQILLHAGQQFVEGDVLHWWHPDTGYGLRTRFSDDLLWLPYVTAHYVRTTGDAGLLNETAPFVTARPLEIDEQEAYLCPESRGRRATVYEHCCRALDRGLTSGPRGLPLIGCGDWNDGMNRVGCAGRGESVWLGFFICHVLDLMLPICRQRGDSERVERYEAYREPLVEALNAAGWDGAWYRRAYYDNGQAVGSAASDECRIDALAQAWAVISGVAPARRAQLAMRAVEERLVDQQAEMIRLLTPPFNRTPNDPGYIKGYLPGIRENGGQYTHGVLWVVRAMAELGRGTRAVELLRMLSPVSHSRTPEQVAVYQTEPYVVAADVYGEPPHVGRGGWTWYTGSAGWMLRVAIESIFGVTLDGGQTLVVNPCISRTWPRATLRYRLPDGKTRYVVTIENTHGRERGLHAATLDGEPLAIEEGVARVPLRFDGKEHHVTLRL